MAPPRAVWAQTGPSQPLADGPVAPFWGNRTGAGGRHAGFPLTGRVGISYEIGMITLTALFARPRRQSARA